jgi:hypothetical protein
VKHPVKDAPGRAEHIYMLTELTLPLGETSSGQHRSTSFAAMYATGPVVLLPLCSPPSLTHQCCKQALVLPVLLNIHCYFSEVLIALMPLCCPLSLMQDIVSTRWPCIYQSRVCFILEK